MPILRDDQNVQWEYHQQSAFPTAAYPQDWIIGVDGTIQYENNRYEYDAMIEVIERELAK